MATEAEVTALYTTTLGRAPDAGGLAYYTNLVNNGVPLAQVQQSLASSPEGQVRALYSDVFGRQADAGGQKFYADQAIAGTPVADIRRSLAYSPESQANIEKIYTTDLKRASDTGGKQYYTDLLAGGGLLSDVQKSIQASTEAQGLLGKTDTTTTTTTGLTAAQLEAKKIADALAAKQAADAFAAQQAALLAAQKITAEQAALNATKFTPQLNALYQKVFGRNVDASGLAYYSNLLAQGTPLSAIEATMRGSPEFQTPGVQTFQKGIRAVPFGSQLMEGLVKQMAQYGQPAAQAGAAQAGATMGSPSLQGFLGVNPAAAAMTPFQQQMQYQAALPSMIQPFNPADIPATYQQQLTPTPRLDISSTTIPAWLQEAINAQRTKDGVVVSDLQKFNTANQVSTNSGLGTTTAGATTGVTTGGTTGVTNNLAAGGIDPRIIQGYAQIGRPGDKIDMPGAQFWQGRLSSGMPISDIYSQMAASPEGLLYAENQAAKLAAANAAAANTGSDF